MMYKLLRYNKIKETHADNEEDPLNIFEIIDHFQSKIGGEIFPELK